MGGRDGGARSRRRYGYDQDGDDSETSDDSDEHSDGDGGRMRLALLDPEEEALADAAVARIRRAQAKGKTNVKLSKEELAAYQRRLQRMEEEEQRRKRREQRISIPLAQLDPGVRRMAQPLEGDNHSPRQSSPELGEERQPGYPPMGYFPPPSSSRAGPHSGSASPRTPSQSQSDTEEGSSPFTYSYVRAGPAGGRHSSDPAAAFADNGALPRPAQPPLDPFQYMMSGSGTSYHAGTGSVHDVAGVYASYGSGVLPDSAGRRRRDDSRVGETSSDDDAPHERLRVSSSGSGSRDRARESRDSRREAVSDSGASRDRTSPPPASKKSSSAQSSSKRKSGSGKSGRKKTK